MAPMALLDLWDLQVRKHPLDQQAPSALSPRRVPRDLLGQLAQ